MESTQGACVSKRTLLFMMRKCSQSKDLVAGRELYRLIVNRGLAADPFLCSYLIYMFSSCGSLLDAANVFSGLDRVDVFSWSAIISAYTGHGFPEKAIELFRIMQNSLIEPNAHVLSVVLKACACAKACLQGKQIHAQVIAAGFASDVFIANSLINMYAKLGDFQLAESIFDSLPKRDVVTWNALIAGYIQGECFEEALEAYTRMLKSSTNPSNVTYVSIIKACSDMEDLEHGQLVHACIVETGIELDSSLGSILVDMYCKSGSVKNAMAIFPHLRNRNEVTWNALILGHALHKDNGTAFLVFHQMQHEGLQISPVTLLSILKVCSQLPAADKGKMIHVQIIECQLNTDRSIQNSLINMYAKSGCMHDALRVVDCVSYKNVVSFTALIAACHEVVDHNTSFQLFYQMQQESVMPNQAVYSIISKSCRNAMDVSLIHCYIIGNGLEQHLSLGSILMSMYIKYGRVDAMYAIFRNFPVHNKAVAWAEVIAAFVQNGESEEALQLFQVMLESGLQVTEVTWMNVLKAFSRRKIFEQGNMLHSHIVIHGYDLQVSIASSLIGMYANCYRIPEARYVFDTLHKKNIVTWNTMVGGYVNQGDSEKTQTLLQEMKLSELEPNVVTYLYLIKLYTRNKALNHGRHVHALIVAEGFDYDLLICNALINMYCEHKNIEDANNVHERMQIRDIVTWNTMMAAICNHPGESEKGLALLQKMQRSGVCPNQVTYVNLLKAFSKPSDLCHGYLVHCLIGESGIKLNSFLGNMLLNMYAKCGSLEIAQKMFDALPNPDIVAWNILISGYARHAHEEQVFLLCEKMFQCNLKPNKVTFICMVKVCSNGSMLDEGRLIHFHILEHSCLPNTEIGNLLISMYINCNRLRDAKKVFESLPMKDAVSWSSIIRGFASVGNELCAYNLFGQMLVKEYDPTAITVLNVLGACCNTMVAFEIHHQLIELKHDRPSNVGTALINVYMRCGSPKDACKVFDALAERNVLAWTNMISGLARHSEYRIALDYFQYMQQEGCMPDEVTLSCVLSIWSSIGLVDDVWMLFQSIIPEYGLQRINHMTDILVRAGFLTHAHDLLKSFPSESRTASQICMTNHCRIYGNYILASGAFQANVLSAC